MPDQVTIQGMLLEVCMKKPAYREVHSLFEGVASEFDEKDRPSDLALQQAFWRLIALGLAFPEFQGLSPILMRLTPKGEAAATESDFNPDFPPRYIERLKGRVPRLSTVVETYVREALATYETEAYLATTVMLGVASEGAMLEMAEAFAEWLDAKGQGKLKEMTVGARENYSTILEEVGKRLATHSSVVPAELSDGLSSKMAIANILRAYRNDAGHPTGKHPSKEECFESLVLFPAYAERVYALKLYFRPES